MHKFTQKALQYLLDLSLTEIHKSRLQTELFLYTQYLPSPNQGGESGDDRTRGTIIFPIAAKPLKIVCTDVYYSNVQKMDTVRAVTLLQETSSNTKIDWVSHATGIGSFGWIGIKVSEYLLNRFTDISISNCFSDHKWSTSVSGELDYTTKVVRKFHFVPLF